jgi:exosortase family protein XrtM
VRFFLLFVVFFLALQRLYIATRPYTETFINHRCNAAVSAWLAEGLTPGMAVESEGPYLTSERGSVDISKGCEGIEVVVILVAAMLSYPMPWRHRLLGILTGTVLVYVLNLFRIIALFLAACYRREWFDTAHVGVGQTIMILLAVLYFLLWIGLAPVAAGGPSASREDPAPGPAD